MLIGASIVTYMSQQKKKTTNPLMLANIEALANGELGGTIYQDRVIYDEIISTEISPYGVTYTYRRDCAIGGSSSCQRGTWSQFINL